MTSTMLLLFYMITIVCVARLYREYIEKHCKQNETKKELDQMDKQILIELQLLKVFSFPHIVDSKFVGLVVFLISNLLTGIVNLSINTLYVANVSAFIIICIYNFVVYFLPYLGYYYILIVNKKKVE